MPSWDLMMLLFYGVATGTAFPRLLRKTFMYSDPAVRAISTYS